MPLSLYNLKNSKADTTLVTHINNGLMSSLDKIKLDDLQAYVHPQTHPVTMITGIANVAKTGNYNDLINKPTIPLTLPASGGNADTVDGKHADSFLSINGGLLRGNISLTDYNVNIRRLDESILIESENQSAFLCSKNSSYLMSNCYWTGASWGKYDATKVSAYLELNADGISIYKAAPGTTSPYIKTDLSSGGIDAAGIDFDNTSANLNGNPTNIQNAINVLSDAWIKISESTLTTPSSIVNITVPNGFRKIKLIGDYIRCNNIEEFQDILLTFNGDNSTSYYSALSQTIQPITPSANIIISNSYISNNNIGNFELTVDNTYANKPKAYTFLYSSYYNGGGSGGGSWINNTMALTQINVSLRTSNVIASGARFILMGMK